MLGFAAAPGISTFPDDLFQPFGGSPALLRFHALEKRTQDRMVPHPLIPPAARFFLPELPFFLQELLLDVPLHLHTVKVFDWLHKLITS
jgi:hypothetical protein